MTDSYEEYHSTLIRAPWAAWGWQPRPPELLIKLVRKGGVSVLQPNPSRAGDRGCNHCDSLAIRTFTRQCFRDQRSLQIISQMFFQPTVTHNLEKRLIMDYKYKVGQKSKNSERLDSWCRISNAKRKSLRLGPWSS